MANQYLSQTLDVVKRIFDIYPPSHLQCLVLCHWRGQGRLDSRRSVIQILQNYKIICLQINCKNNLKSILIFVDLKKGLCNKQSQGSNIVHLLLVLLRLFLMRGNRGSSSTSISTSLTLSLIFI